MAGKPSTRPRWRTDVWEQLTTAEKLVWWALDDLRQQQGNPVHIKSTRLAEMLGMGDATVRRAFARFEQLAVAERQSQRGSHSVIYLKSYYTPVRRRESPD